MKSVEKLGRVVIVGAGAVGSYYGGRLAQHGGDVTFLLRSDYDAVKETGLTFQSSSGDFKLETPKIAKSAEEIGEVDLVIVTWKATSNDKFKEVLTPLVGDNTLLVTLQNGIGSAEKLAELFGEERVVGGLCFVCINRLEPGLISHTAGGIVSIAPFGSVDRQQVAQLAAAFEESNVPCKLSDDLSLIQWQKLVWNVPFNGLAISKGGVTTDVLLEKHEQEVRELMAEVISGAAALGHEISSEVIDQQIERTRGMGAYRPSSMIDFVEGRPVEVEAIWEFPFELAAAKGAHLPLWEDLLSELREKVKVFS